MDARRLQAPLGLEEEEPELRPVRILAVAAALALVLAGTGCGEKSESSNEAPATHTLDLVLDWFPNPDHVAIYEAQARGYFKQVGLDVRTHVPSDPAAPIKQVAAGRADLAISYEPEVLLAKEQGLDVVAVGALVDRPLTSMIWLKSSKIGGIGGLRGKTIATAGIPYQDAYLGTILARAGLSPSDVKAVNVGYGLLPAIVGGSAQAVLGGFSNVEGVDLRLRGKDPVVTPVDKLGVPTYDELVLVAKRDRLEEDPESIRLFLAALARGTAAAAKSPKATTKALLEANSDLDPKLTEAEVKATLPLLGAPSGSGSTGPPYGFMNPAEWSRFIAWMGENGLISGRPPPAAVLSNAYLPGGVPQ
jgi:putative hydroxymethylpyrimidine transport system substrate-binding protein